MHCKLTITINECCKIYICIAHCRFMSVNALITVNKVYFFNDLMALNNKKATHQHMPDVVIGPLESAESDTGPQ